MKRFSKVSFDDIKTIQVDSGVLLKEFDVENPVFLPENVICATSGGINPVCAPEYYDFGEDVDNAKPSKETKRIRGWNATISFTTLTTSLTAIKLALGAADISGKVLNLRQRLQYAKDFKDIWWVGKRADDKLIAIRLIRSLSDSGFSLQTNKRGKGQISVTLKGHCSFSDIKKVPMEIYVLAENDSPEVPTAAMYLYGTPSTSGNIGLRVGESVTYYGGAVLPPLPERDESVYPYAWIIKKLFGGYYLYLLSELIYQQSSGGENAIEFSPTNAVRYSCGNGGTAWEESPVTESGVTTISWSMWANFDLLNGDNSIYIAASDPIPVSGLVGNSYNGTVLPDIDTIYTDELKAQYPNAIIFKPWSTAFTLKVFPKDSYYSSTANGLRTYRTDGTAIHWTWLADRGWGIAEEASGGSYVVFEKAIWTNFDLLNSDNTVYLSASDPIPVYE